MGQASLQFVREFDVAPAALFAAISDHEGMSRWLDVRVTLVARGDAQGVGAVRRVEVSGLSFDETVVYSDAPVRLVYRITRGVPVSFHRGEMLVEALGADRSRLTWNIVMVGSIPGLVHGIALALRPAIEGGLVKLEAILRERSGVALEQHA